jgi:hypothetical protein
MSTFMKFTELYANRPILLNIGAIVTLAPVMQDDKVLGTRVGLGTDYALDVKEPIEAFFQRPTQADPPDSGKGEKENGKEN